MLWRSCFCILLWYSSNPVHQVILKQNAALWQTKSPVPKAEVKTNAGSFPCCLLRAAEINFKYFQGSGLADVVPEWSWGLTFIWLFYRLHFPCCWGSTQLKLHYWCLSHVYLWQGRVWFFLFTEEHFTLQQTWFGPAGFFCIQSFIGICSSIYS